MTKYIKVDSCFFKEKDDRGNWKDNLERPAIMISTRYASVKFGIKDVDYLIEELMKIIKNEEE